MAEIRIKDQDTNENPALSDYFVTDNNVGTRKLTGTELRDLILNEKDPDDLLTDSDIVDNLTSTDTDKALSAKQGKHLEDNKAETSSLHNQQHDIDSTEDHNGVEGATEDNIVVFDANGLPKDGGQAIADVGGGGAEVGEVRQFAGTAPSGWLACDGSAYLQSAYSDLYSELGIRHDFSGWIRHGGHNAGNFVETSDNVIVGGGYADFTYSTDDGDTWTNVSAGHTYQFLGILTNDRIVAGTVTGRIYTSDDAGQSWTRRDEDAGDPLGGNACNMALTLDDRSAVLLLGDGGTLLKTTDGVSYTSLTSGTIADLSSGAIGPDGRIVVVSDSDGSAAIYSDDDGDTWTVSNEGPYAGRTAYCIVYSSILDLYVSYCAAWAFSVSSDGDYWNRFDYDILASYVTLEVEDSFLTSGTASGSSMVSKEPGDKATNFELPRPSGSENFMYTLFETSTGAVLGSRATSGTGEIYKLNKAYDVGTSFIVPDYKVANGYSHNSYIYSGVE